VRKEWSLSRENIALASAFRRQFALVLSELILSQEGLDDAQLIFGELTGNALRHGADPITITLESVGTHAMLHVDDSGQGFPLRDVRHLEPALLEHGRGLLIVQTLARSFSVQHLLPIGCRVSVELPITLRSDVCATSRVDARGS
jgi:anti-sigma regulatory factor (Ser/Thr protein kinase)